MTKADLSPALVAAQPRLALNPREAAIALGVSERLLWSMTVAGELPSLKLRGRRVYPVVLLNKYLAERAEGGRQ